MRPDILHVDLDAFYVSVERRRDPSLEGRPVIVGGDGSRGVVLSCSYETRAHGVRNGIPSVRAKRLCPDAVFVRPGFPRYAEASKGFRRILDEITPTVEPLSLDEAFCDVSHAHTLFGSSAEIGARIRARVRDELGLICSVGAGPTKLVAKLANKACKPDGLLVVEDPDDFLRPLPLEDLWGVGDATARTLRRLGLRTIGDVADAEEAMLRREVGEAAGAHLASIARGGDDREVVVGRRAKSVGAEETFGEDIDDPDRLAAELLRLSDRVASRLIANDLRGRTVTVKIRLQDFETHTRSRTLDHPTDDAWTLHRTAVEAFGSFRRGRRKVRLLGVSVSSFVEGPVAKQLTLEKEPSFAEAERALDAVRRRFGSDAVRFARLVEPEDP